MNLLRDSTPAQLIHNICPCPFFDGAADARELQDVLETMELEPRLQKALVLLKKEQQLASLQQSIKADVEKRIDKQQRTYFLMEQLKSIKKVCPHLSMTNHMVDLRFRLSVVHSKFLLSCFPFVSSHRRSWAWRRTTRTRWSPNSPIERPS